MEDTKEKIMENIKEKVGEYITLICLNEKMYQQGHLSLEEREKMKQQIMKKYHVSITNLKSEYFLHPLDENMDMDK